MQCNTLTRLHCIFPLRCGLNKSIFSAFTEKFSLFKGGRFADFQANCETQGLYTLLVIAK
jgi:hypothetical protein